MELLVPRTLITGVGLLEDSLPLLIMKSKRAVCSESIIRWGWHRTRTCHVLQKIAARHGAAVSSELRSGICGFCRLHLRGRSCCTVLHDLEKGFRVVRDQHRL